MKIKIIEFFLRRRIFLLIILLMILGGYIRLLDFGKNPPSLSVDEVSIGYNAYSISKTARDEHGDFLPLSFKSLGDYKPPVYIYLTSISVAIFGLNEFSVRFMSLLFSIIFIPLIYLLYLEIFKEKKYALLGVILISISPWNVYFSRVASESNVAMVLTAGGILFLLKALKGGWKYGPLSSLLFALSIYTYHAQRLFVPLFVFALLFLKRKEILLERKKEVGVFLALFLVLVILPLSSFVFGLDSTRPQATFILNDPNLQRWVLPDISLDVPRVIKIIDDLFIQKILIISFWIRKYLAYFHPSFLFFNGLNITSSDIYGLGVHYLFELPWIILGFILLFLRKNKGNYILILWIAAGLFPASLTMNEQHPIRALIILPALIAVSVMGMLFCLEKIHQILSGKIKLLIYCLYGVIIVISLIQAYSLYFFHFPKQKGKEFMEGTREVVEYIQSNQDKYKEIVIDSRRGSEGQYIVNVPHLYLLFYLKYDPATYQNEKKVIGENNFSFNKFTIRNINWQENEDRSHKGVLLVGTPWNFPEKDLKSEQVLKRVYLSNGELVHLIITP